MAPENALFQRRSQKLRKGTVLPRKALAIGLLTRRAPMSAMVALQSCSGTRWRPLTGSRSLQTGAVKADTAFARGGWNGWEWSWWCSCRGPGPPSCTPKHRLPSWQAMGRWTGVCRDSRARTTRSAKVNGALWLPWSEVACRTSGGRQVAEVERKRRSEGSRLRGAEISGVQLERMQW